MNSRRGEFVQAMARHGLRITEQRKMLAQLFAEAHGFLSAKELYQRMAITYKGLSFDTVYRNIKLLTELGVLEMFQFEEGNKFRIGCFDHRHHHHHMICLSCSNVYPLDYCPMQNLEIPESFQVVKHSFEIYGYCVSCQRDEEITPIRSMLSPYLKEEQPCC
ncbi:transcriptional repressor [Paenibacillus alkaliterrae]|uniref:Fur family transcriptional regulator n=1 Tax=Paenibacillus alkaliterrae TaxID=320909 RepID=UPI001F244E05|nr:Fur family transcriptional regulator [Paenibacillus alkaliterrae]MCF2940324.1 transcriptional repressor [Paenibacillus alkaliterrae]